MAKLHQLQVETTLISQFFVRKRSNFSQQCDFHNYLPKVRNTLFLHHTVNIGNRKIKKCNRDTRVCCVTILFHKCHIPKIKLLTRVPQSKPTQLLVNMCWIMKIVCQIPMANCNKHKPEAISKLVNALRDGTSTVPPTGSKARQLETKHRFSVCEKLRLKKMS